MGTKKEQQQFTVVVDTRETTPYLFQLHGGDIVVEKLDEGDYSAVGFQQAISIERKTKSDAYKSLGKDRPRFKREIERLAEYTYAAIVIECGLVDFLNPPKNSELNPKAAMASLVSWSVRYGIHVWFAGTRLHAEALTYRLIEKFVKNSEARE